MTKRDLVVKIAADTNLIQSDVANVVQKTLDYIAEELVAGRNIELRNFGVFEIKVRQEPQGTQPEQARSDSGDSGTCRRQVQSRERTQRAHCETRFSIIALFLY